MANLKVGLLVGKREWWLELLLVERMVGMMVDQKEHLIMVLQ